MCCKYNAEKLPAWWTKSKKIRTKRTFFIKYFNNYAF